MKKLFALLLIALTSAMAFAKPDWRGRVIDENGEAVAFANVVLLSKTDSTAISGVTTDMDGYYKVVTDAKDGILMVAIIGYDTVYVTPSDSQTIVLKTASEYLEGAVATAVMPKTKVTAEGLQTSVRGSVIENVGTAKDVLARTPGMIKGQNGLEVIGKGSPLIYINGRKITDATELDRLLSSEIQSVEVITNPGAQYDATVKSVVRIKTIRRQGEGFGFTANLSDAQSLRFSEINDPNLNLNLNYRHKSVDYFFGGNVFQYTSNQASDVHHETTATPKFSSVGTLTNRYQQKSVYANGGINWQISQNHSMGFKAELSENLDVTSHQIVNDDMYKNGVIYDKVLTIGDNYIDKKPYSISSNVYYNGTVGKMNIDFNADYYNVQSYNKQHTEETSDITHDAVIDNESKSDSRLYATKLILSYPVWKGGLQVGTEETFTKRNDDYKITGVQNINSSSSTVNENNIAGFVSYGFALPKFGQMSVGLRYEHVGYTYTDKMYSGSFEKNYDNLFPNVSYSNAFGPVQAILSYTKKTSRPGFSQLSDAVRYNSKYIIQSGNSRLQPQVISDFSLTTVYKYMAFIASYNRTDDMIATWSSVYNDDGVIMVNPKNLAKPSRQLSAFVNLTPTVGIWNINYTVGVQQQWLKVDAEDVTAPKGIREISFSDKPMFIAQMFNTFTFKKGWQFEFGGEFHSKANIQNLYIENNYLDLTSAIQKTCLKDGSLVVRLSAEDMAGLANNNVTADYGNYLIAQTNVMDTKRITLSVKYRFNAAQNKYKGTGAGSDAKGRMKN